MLAEKQISFRVDTVSQAENPDLFAGIVHEQYSDAVNMPIPLYRLQNLPDLLNLFNHPSSTLREEVDKLADEEQCKQHQQELESRLKMLYNARENLLRRVRAGDQTCDNKLPFVDKKISATETLLEQLKVQGNFRAPCRAGEQH